VDAQLEAVNAAEEATVRSQVLDTLVQAARDGRLGSVLRSVAHTRAGGGLETTESSPDPVGVLRAKAAAALAKAAEDGRLVTALQKHEKCDDPVDGVAADVKPTATPVEQAEVVMPAVDQGRLKSLEEFRPMSEEEKAPVDAEEVAAARRRLNTNPGATQQQVRSFAQSLTANIFRQSHGLAAQRATAQRKFSPGVTYTTVPRAAPATTAAQSASPLQVTTGTVAAAAPSITSAVPATTATTVSAAGSVGHCKPADSTANRGAPICGITSMGTVAASSNVLSSGTAGGSTNQCGRTKSPVPALNMPAVNALPRRARDGKPPSPIPAEEGAFI
jgi:hypothetical protein